jgi:kinesin family protein 11
MKRDLSVPAKLPDTSPAERCERQNIEVLVRVRPINPKELDVSRLKTITVLSQNSLLICDPVVVPNPFGHNYIDRQKRVHYTFTHVINENEGQELVYELGADKILQDVLKGFSATIFAYGSTGAGKTYTFFKKNDG